MEYGLLLLVNIFTGKYLKDMNIFYEFKIKLNIIVNISLL